MKCFVYVIQSSQDGRLYVGISRNPIIRIKEHNYGHTFSTKGFRPWKMVYMEELEDRESARKREKYLKSGIGKKF